MNLALILFLGGAVVVVWIYLWARQQIDQDSGWELEEIMRDIPAADNGNALLISQEHGKLIYANEPARRWVGMNGGLPHLEKFASAADPSDNFLQLFTAEGQSSFQLGKRWVEASSHRIPNGTEMRTVIVMRELSSTTSNPDALDMNQAMSLINEMGELVNASMGLEQVLPSILAIIRRVITSDAGEITLWDEEAEVLHQRGWDGDPTYLISLSEHGGQYAVGEGISGWIAKYHKPVILNTQDDLSGIQPKLVEKNPYQSFISVPLKLGNHFIGTLELASEEPNRYSRSDLALLQAVSKTVSGIIYNTDIYAQQAQRVDDLANLQRIVKLEQTDKNGAASVYAALNERIAKLLSADMAGIFLYDEERQGLVAYPPFQGLPEALVRTLFIPMPKDSPQRDIWQNQSYWISNDVADEPLVEALGLMPVVSVSGITNTAWLPLEISNQRIGVLAVSNKRTEGGFNARDIQHLMVLSSQAAIIIENLRLFERGRRMDTELVGLQELTNAIGALSHETEFYGEITERIARLMEIEMCGILLYDEERKQLVSQLPFYGVNEDFVHDYVIELQPGTVMEQLWDEESYWYSNRVQADSLVFEASLNELAEEIGVHKTLIAVLQASGRKLGVVQVSNKVGGKDFDDSDARLLMIFATQTAAIIENARLFREARRSAEQAQGLRRVAELAGNVLTSQDSFTPVLAEISKLTQSEVVFVNVLNQQNGSLITYPRWVYGLELSEPIVQDIYADGFEYSPVSSHRPFLGNDIQNDRRVLPTYQQVAEK